MNNIEKLAVEREAFEQWYASASLRGVTFIRTEIGYSDPAQHASWEGWIAKALQSSEPEAWNIAIEKCADIVGRYEPNTEDALGKYCERNSIYDEIMLLKSTHPPASVPLEKYNKLEQQLAELTDAYLLMRTGLNCLSDKAITGNQADILLGSEIPDFINYKERMRDIGSWEKLLTLAKGDWVKQAIAEAEGK